MLRDTFATCWLLLLLLLPFVHVQVRTSRRCGGTLLLRCAML
jgi:hypothetical protein